MKCRHLSSIQDVEPRTPERCEDCLATGEPVGPLPLCMSCGHVGCCDASMNRHATVHARSSGHPIVRSFEPGETWLYCFVDDALVGEA